jgi:Ser/Thr protein kinase RdoA (MazF antagonist)
MQFDQPFERLTDDAAAAILRETWGIEGETLTRLDTERDDSFRVTTNGTHYLLKVAHPADDPLYVNLQTAALSHAADQSGLPLQRLLLTAEGEIEPEVDGRVARLLTWLPGEPNRPIEPRLFGQTLGRLSDALSDFDHPAAHREFVWDVARLDLVRDLQQQFPNDLVTEVFALWDSLDLSDLPRHVIHNDFHPGNVLTDGENITGIVDFGDVVYTARVVDVAVALCYFGWHDELIEGFSSVVPLTDQEREALPMLVAARYVQRILLNQLLGRYDPRSQLASLQEHLERIR